MKNKYKCCKTCVANEWKPLRPPTRYKKMTPKQILARGIKEYLIAIKERATLKVNVEG